MIELRDEVVLDAAPEAVWAWLEALPEHYRDWHAEDRWSALRRVRPL